MTHVALPKAISDMPPRSEKYANNQSLEELHKKEEFSKLLFIARPSHLPNA